MALGLDGGLASQALVDVVSWLGEAGTAIEEEERGALGEMVAQEDGVMIALALQKGDRVGATEAFF
jgi:hypothetical protein